MSFRNSNVLGNSITSGFSNEEIAEGTFIDDLSHLRLSYYQQRGMSHENIPNFEESADDSGLTSNCSVTMEEKPTVDTMLMELTELKEESEREKRREIYISKIPELPHPSFTVASIIASASQKMDSGIYLKYNNRIEESRKCDCRDEKLEFNPKRRSTLKPKNYRS